jgi:hypothetical protein
VEIVAVDIDVANTAKGKQNAKCIAVDFDGCLCVDRYPEIGEPVQYVIDLLAERKQYGDKLILWTCRCGEKLDEAVRWCAEHGLTFDAVNDNLPENIEKYGNNSRKVWADEYWDDRNMAIAKGIVV